MPRSHSIWIVLDWNPVDDTIDVVYAATVKHELVTFLKGQGERIHLLSVYKISDGDRNWPIDTGKRIDVEDLIGES